MNINGKQIKIGTSIGVAAYPIHANTIDSLIDIADHEMYKAKHGRKKPVLRDKQSNQSVIVFPGSSARS